ncbi:laminin subunit gamma-1 [Patella vulgata]|uniref:laminin subunit gamma-1 n=1 Tax=Patella vulgata TaxID=6465 RepID=UPI0021801CA3|nr:laminin subunit gamma-1 [Patella vulgata]
MAVWDKSGELGGTFSYGIFTRKMISFVLFTYLGLLSHSVSAQEDQFRGRSSCYDAYGRPQRCMPEFVNAAYDVSVESTNTCGLDKTEEYCLQTGVTGATKSCNNYCDSRRPGYNHPPEFMSDFNNNYNWTWWQSQTMLEGTQYPNQVNLTIHLRKAYSITYVRIRFHSPRPESFAIFKRNGNGPWIPYQFYSGSCEKTYNLPRRGVITRENEAVAICNDEFSDISPLTGGSVAFSTLEGRPSSTSFEDSPVLQDWVTATDIKIVLTRMNTFGDEVFGDPQVLKSYFYAISDLSIGARCQCNGHANQCYTITTQGLQDQQICRCEHNTTGPNCQECLPFFNDRPWSRAYETEANECRPCNCNGLSNQCYFDPELYRATGHGGHCENCRDNTDGVNCENCRVNHYRRVPENRCIDCQCNEVGSESMQCNGNGQCRCKPGVAGEKCDRCEANFYEFGPLGCRACSCSAAGSVDGVLRCDPRNGACSCKVNVEGQNCDTCKPGYFGLSEDNPFGCLQCFCYGQASVCDASPSYFARSILTDFETGEILISHTHNSLPW